MEKSGWFDFMFPFLRRIVWRQPPRPLQVRLVQAGEICLRLNAKKVYHKMFPCCLRATAITGTETWRESGEDKREFEELLKQDWLKFDRRKKR